MPQKELGRSRFLQYTPKRAHFFLLRAVNVERERERERGTRFTLARLSCKTVLTFRYILQTFNTTDDKNTCNSVYKSSGCQIKPQSDIRCNRFATSPRLTIYTDRRGRNKVPDRSRRGCREVGD